jgi:hypothetical protein
MALGATCERSKELNPRQHADRSVFRIETEVPNGRGNEKQSGQEAAVAR